MQHIGNSCKYNNGNYCSFNQCTSSLIDKFSTRERQLSRHLGAQMRVATMLNNNFRFRDKNNTYLVHHLRVVTKHIHGHLDLPMKPIKHVC